MRRKMELEWSHTLKNIKGTHGGFWALEKPLGVRSKIVLFWASKMRKIALSPTLRCFD
jgi:hypothetical protein